MNHTGIPFEKSQVKQVPYLELTPPYELGENAIRKMPSMKVNLLSHRIKVIPFRDEELAKNSIQNVDQVCEQTCDFCKSFYALEWAVEQDKWEEVTADYDGFGHLCISCFDKLACIKGIKWKHAITLLHFCGHAENFKLEIQDEV